MQTPEDTLTRLYEDVWNGSNPDTANELVHEEYHIHDRELAAEMRGPALYRALARGTRDIFPDMTVTKEDILGADEMVALRWTMTGTHEGGPMFGVEPTGQEVELTAIEINRFEDGKLIETWTQSDQLGLVQQLGGELEDS
ncbi:cyclase [Haladaptatus sp. W1]|uniref:ester cyclase n=1 Tax=Haladaptatus sp. W1 TaxID=1897478 RepID=UPI000849C3E7|nr:ester cyclase [Haladaptatus sp. W1]ODR82081.1 cyclase [Haladaptatus sp. W1]